MARQRTTVDSTTFELVDQTTTNRTSIISDPYAIAHVQLVQRTENTPETKLADASIEFVSGVLVGTAVTGFTIWQGRKGVFLSVPGRPYENAKKEKKTFRYVRPADDNRRDLPVGLTHLILDAYEQLVATTDRTHPPTT